MSRRARCQVGTPRAPRAPLRHPRPAAFPPGALAARRRALDPLILVHCEGELELGLVGVLTVLLPLAAH